MLSEKNAKRLIGFLLPILLAVTSVFWLSDVVPKTEIMTNSLESLDESKNTVAMFTGATIAASVAISALPDDFATPLANSLANMNKYFIVVLVALFLERIILVEGVEIVFLYAIPIACGLFILYQLSKQEFFKNIATKILILSIAIVLVIPCSTTFSKVVGSDYLDYVDSTIEETQHGSDVINEALSAESSKSGIFQKISATLSNVITGAKELLNYFNGLIKKCINAIAIMIIMTVVLPVIILLFFKWLLKELFSISIPVTMNKKVESKGTER